MMEIDKLRVIFKKFCFLIFILFIFCFHSNLQIIQAFPMNNDRSEFITEELRLKVPAKYKEAWLLAEMNVWDPWLSKQDGYMGREIFWDKEKEEALILVSWESKQIWKSIPMSEVYEVQEKFEYNIKTALNISENPFQLIYEGELDKQG